MDCPGDTPLSFVQRRLWTLSRRIEPCWAYHVSAPFDLRGPLDADVLERALTAVAERHIPLRTRIVERDGAPVACVDAGGRVDLRRLDASTRADPERAALDYWKQIFRESFDLARDAALRAGLIRLAPDHHWLTLIVHHIAFDCWSLGVLQRELSALYGALLLDRPSPLPRLSAQYSDFIDWQRLQLRSEIEDEQLRFWRERLAGASLVHRLPLDRPRPATLNLNGDVFPFSLDADLCAALRRLAADRGATLFMTLLTGVVGLFARHGQARDWIIGAPIANRQRLAFEDLIGPFANTLALRLEWEGDPSFKQLLALTKKVARGAYANLDLPFERLVDELVTERSMGHPPLVQIVFALHNAPRADLHLHGLEVKELRKRVTHIRFELECDLFEVGEHLEGSWAYNTNLFEERTIAVLHEHFAALLRSAVAAPNALLSRLSLWGPGEQAQVLGQWNATTRPYPKDLCVHQLFEEEVEHTPDAIALILEDRELSYRALNESANRVAHVLIARGVGPDTRVGLCVERSLELVIGLLAILKAGGAYVPLDPDAPAERLSFMMADSDAALLVTTEPLSARLSGLTGTQVFLDDAVGLAAASVANPDIPLNPLHAAYVVYISDSTDRPKGVLVPHRAVVSLVCNTDYCRFDRDRVFLQFALVVSDIANFEIWGALLHGARLVLVPAGRTTLKQLLLTIRGYGVTSAYFTAGLFKQLLDTDVQALAGLEDLLIGGEALSAAQAAKAKQALTRTTITNAYGPTEATTFASTYRIPDDQGPGAIPIGRPIADTRVYILGHGLLPQPIGIPGELCIAGDGLAHGYLNRPELTAEHFVEIESLGRRERIYRTGDLARWRPDGNLEFLGRLEQQLELRSFHIEPGEIEKVLGTQPGIQDTLVVTREESDGEKRLVAYVVLDQNTPPATTPALCRALSEQLPDHMIPSTFVPLNALPLTPDGKVDHDALPAPELDRITLGIRYTAPRTPTERALAELWQEVLMLSEPPGVYDDFFALGGHSLLSARLVNEIEEVFGREVPQRTFFKEPTIAALADALGDAPAQSATQNCDGTDIDLSPSNTDAPPQRRFLDPALYHQLQSFAGSWRGERAGPDSLIVGRHTKGTRPPLFWVFQGQYELHQLARYTGSDQPLYGMRSGHLFMDYTENNIQGIALDYVREIEALRPDGPLVIGGNCQGGVIALAIAQHLLRRGRHVPLTILMEWFFPPQPYAGPVGLIFGRESGVANPYLRFDHPELMWQRVWPERWVEIIPGGHGRFFMGPCVQTLAEAVRRLIDRAGARAPYLLPVDALRARIVVDDVPERLRAGERYELPVRVTNSSPVDWPDGDRIGLMLVNHWEDADGEPVRHKDGSVALPRLACGAHAEVVLPIRTPMRVGEIQLVLRLAEQGVMWHPRPCEPVYIRVRIEETSEEREVATEPEGVEAPRTAPAHAVSESPLTQAPKPIRELGLNALERGDFSAARELLGTVVEHARTVLPGYAEALHHEGCHAEAELAWRQAIQGDADNPELWFGLARSHQAQDAQNPAIDAFLRALELNLAHPERALAFLLPLARSQGRVAEIEAPMRQALEEEPQDTELLSIGARIQIQLGHADAALALARRLVRGRPDNPQPSANIFQMMNARGFKDQVAVLLDDLKTAFPNEAIVMELSAVVALTHTQNPGEALELCERALRMDPQRHSILLIQGRCLLALDEPDAALKVFEQAVTQLGDHAPAFALRGKTHRLLGNTRAACADLRRALDLNPDSPWISNELAAAEER